MKVVVTGATGLVGRPLVARIVERGDAVTALVRNPDTRLDGATLVHADLEAPGAWCDALDGADAVIHLAGEPIAAERWTARRKQLLRDSRVETARTIVEAIGRAAVKPRVLVGASGIDYYPPAIGIDDFADDPVTEADPPGDGFLARLCARWEAEIAAAGALGVRTVSMRTGLVLAPGASGGGGGALARMAAPFRFFVGGPIGSGRQRVSWVHLDDAVGAYIAAIDDARFTGAVNVVAGSVSNADFARAIGRALHRPAFARVPAFALRLAVGELAGSILTGRNAVPAKLQALGFAFIYPQLANALAACFAGHTAR